MLRLQTIKLLDAFALIKSKTYFKQHIMSRYCRGDLTFDEMEYLFAAHKLGAA